WIAGERDQFAVKLNFYPDPDQGRGVSAPYAATWGGFEIWVAGLNLCQHRDQDTSLDAVHWYLLPLLRWWIDQWDFLLHEERLPGRNAAPDAWTSLRRTIDPPPSL